MGHDVVVLAVHGMGATKADFADDLESGLRKRLDDAWNSVYFDSIYYQEVLQPNQERVMRQMMKGGAIDFVKLRRFMLYGFSDAAGLERGSHIPGSPYEQVQTIIRQTLEKAYDFIGETRPVVLIAQSLGGQVMSNYIWDAQRRGGASCGVWCSRDGGVDRDARANFTRLKSLRYFYTTGCNIPIFVSGLPDDQIKAITTNGKGYSFRWKNYYDEDDVLGWPLKPLSTSYKTAIHRDYEINVGGLLNSWNPMSHTSYWRDRDVLKPLVRDIQSLVGGQ
ncbi:MAG: hypothetical protein AAF432_08785 [Planctomycetota bacterium]